MRPPPEPAKEAGITGEVMQIENRTPFAAEAMPASGPEERPVVTVIVKATIAIEADASLRIAAEQLPIFFGDEPYDPVKGGSMKFESDIAPFKPQADIVLVGTAYAPDGVAARQVETSLRVGKRIKKLQVTGDRNWQYLGRFLPVTATEPVPFVKMPLVYERAFGGIDTEGGGFCAENLVGRGCYGKKSEKVLDGAPLPNIEDPEQPITNWKDRPLPAGYGYYGRAWQPRAGFLGTYDEAWRAQRAPKPPLDFRFDYYNAAHPDLQKEGYLAGDEEVELINLTPDGYLRFRLPALRVNCSCVKSKVNPLEAESAKDSADDTTEPVTMNLDTLCLMPDESRLFIVWRGLCPVRDMTALELKRVEIDNAGALP